MRILIVHSRYRSGAISGENAVVRDEAELLRRGGHDVHELSLDPPDAELARARMGLRTTWSTAAVRRVRSMIRRGIDVVHAHNLFPMLSPAVLRVGSEEGAAVVMTLHNYRLLCLAATFFRDGATCEACLGRQPWPGVRYSCYRDNRMASAALASSIVVHRFARTFDKVDRFLAVSAFVRTKHLEAGFDPARIVVKPNFNWPMPERVGTGDYFLYLGRLSPEKGAAWLAERWRPELGRLVVAGDGPDAPILRAAAHRSVEWRGGVAPQDVPGLLTQARALLVPSRSYEGASRTLVEANAAGVPVIAGRIGSLVEHVENEVSGLLVDPTDEAAWLDAVTRLNDATVSRSLGEGARSLWAERFSPERSLHALEEIYEGARTAPG